VTIYRTIGWSIGQLGVDIDHFHNHCVMDVTADKKEEKQ